MDNALNLSGQSTPNLPSGHPSAQSHTTYSHVACPYISQQLQQQQAQQAQHQQTHQAQATFATSHSVTTGGQYNNMFSLPAPANAPIPIGHHQQHPGIGPTGILPAPYNFQQQYQQSMQHRAYVYGSGPDYFMPGQPPASLSSVLHNGQPLPWPQIQPAQAHYGGMHSVGTAAVPPVPRVMGQASTFTPQYQYSAFSNTYASSPPTAAAAQTHSNTPAPTHQQARLPSLSAMPTLPALSTVSTVSTASTASTPALSTVSSPAPPLTSVPAQSSHFEFRGHGSDQSSLADGSWSTGFLYPRQSQEQTQERERGRERELGLEREQDQAREQAREQEQEREQLPSPPGREGAESQESETRTGNSRTSAVRGLYELQYLHRHEDRAVPQELQNRQNRPNRQHRPNRQNHGRSMPLVQERHAQGITIHPPRSTARAGPSRSPGGIARTQAILQAFNNRAAAEQILRGSLTTQRVASKSAIESLESVELASLADDERMCIICYNDFGVANPEGVNEAPLRLSKCRHVFGDHCIKKWLGQSNSCPYCRDKLPSQLSATRFVIQPDANVRVVEQYLAATNHLHDAYEGELQTFISEASANALFGSRSTSPASSTEMSPEPATDDYPPISDSEADVDPNANAVASANATTRNPITDLRRPPSSLANNAAAPAADTPHSRAPPNPLSPTAPRTITGRRGPPDVLEDDRRQRRRGSVASTSSLSSPSSPSAVPYSPESRMAYYQAQMARHARLPSAARRSYQIQYQMQQVRNAHQLHQHILSTAAPALGSPYSPFYQSSTATTSGATTSLTPPLPQPQPPQSSPAIVNGSNITYFAGQATQRTVSPPTSDANRPAIVNGSNVNYASFSPSLQ